MKRDPDNDKVALWCGYAGTGKAMGRLSAADSARESLDVLLDRIEEHELPIEAFSWYLDLRKFGTIPHSGFGAGLERTVSWICGTQNMCAKTQSHSPGCLHDCIPDRT